MHFACSRCAHRQAEDASCSGCGHDVVQDMRDPRGREVLRETESRLYRRRLGRYVGLGAVVGLVLAPLFVYAYVRIMGPDAPESAMLAPASVKWKVRLVGGLLFVLWAGCCLGIIALLERNLGRRRKFPYLDEYER